MKYDKRDSIEREREREREIERYREGGKINNSIIWGCISMVTKILSSIQRCAT